MENRYNYGGKDFFNEGLSDTYIRKPTVRQAGMLYLTAVLLLVFVGSRVQKHNFNTGIFVTEFVLILLPPLIFLYIKKYDIPKLLRLNRISTANLLLILMLMIFALPLVGALNFVNLMLLKSVFGKVMISQPPIAADPRGLLVNILLIGGSAGICEEVLFRGTIQRGFERFGAAKAILITSFLFGLMHVDFQKLLGTFLLGALIGFIVYRTDSIFGGMFAHFTNNSIAVLLTFGMNRLAQSVKAPGIGNAGGKAAVSDLDISAIFNMPREQLMIIVIFWVIVVIFCACVFSALIFALLRNTPKTTAGIGREVSVKTENKLVWMLPGMLVVGFLYFAEGLKLKGVSNPFIESIIRFLGLR